MLHISAQGEYSLLLARYLADHPGTRWLASIALDLGIPEPMLRKVANRLVRAGVLASELGRSGGVSLAKPDLSVYDVLAAAGEDLSVTACTHDGECARSGSCGIEPIMIQLQRGMEAMLRLQRISAR